MRKFSGTGVALVTPFDHTGAVDYTALTTIVNQQIENGTDFLVVQGTTAETATLTEEEKVKVLNHVITVNDGKLPIVLGMGGNNTMELVEKIKNFQTKGVDGFLTVSPYYNKPTQEGIFQHYKAIDEVSSLPIIAYNVPGRTGSNMTAETTLRIAALQNIVAVKEASGDLEQVMSIIEKAPEGFLILSGDDALTLPMIALGAHGVISVVANAFPARFSAMVQSALANDFVKARKEHYPLLEVTKLLFKEGNPGGVKSALAHLNWSTDELRLPLVNVSKSTDKLIAAEVSKLN